MTACSVPRPRASRLSALLGLTATCALWGLSFPLMKALGLHASARSPGINTWFVAAATVSVRFALSALVLASFGWSRPRRAELAQGILLGMASSAGMTLEMDALNFSPATTVAFLTQGYVVILPIVGALAARAWPRARTVLCVLISGTGLAILSSFDWSALRLGRGETETLLSTCTFAVQILCLDAKAFSENRTRVVTTIMFMSVAACSAPVAAAFGHLSDIGLLFGSSVAMTLVLALTVPCTLFAFSLMNRYQPAVSASEAGIIYGAEPLFTSVFALFLPAILGGFAEVEYANEELTPRLLLGGGLVVLANVLLHVRRRLVPAPLQALAENDN